MGKKIHTRVAHGSKEEALEMGSGYEHKWCVVQKRRENAD
jgi:hypothetical protein